MGGPITNTSPGSTSSSGGVDNSTQTSSGGSGVTPITDTITTAAVGSDVQTSQSNQPQLVAPSREYSLDAILTAIRNLSQASAKTAVTHAQQSTQQLEDTQTLAGSLSETLMKEETGNFLGFFLENIYNQLFKAYISRYQTQNEKYHDIIQLVYTSHAEKKIVLSLIGAGLATDTPPGINTNNTVGSGERGVLIDSKILQEQVQRTNLRKVDAKKRDEIEKKLVDNLLSFSNNLLKNSALLALLPSQGVIADAIPSLPADSPAHTISFAVSLLNRVSENTQLGITEDVLKSTLKKNPEFAGLSDTDIQQLAAGTNLSHVIISLKLIEQSLGLPGLFAQFLPQFSKSINVQQIISQALTEIKPELSAQLAALKTHFLNQGFEKKQAEFLANVTISLTSPALLFPRISANISPKTINVDTLETSLAASLVLDNHKLSPEKALEIAKNTVNAVLASDESQTSNQFRANLSDQLSLYNVKRSDEIAQNVLLVPAANPDLSTTIPVSQPAPVPEPAPVAQTASTAPHDQVASTLPDVHAASTQNESTAPITTAITTASLVVPSQNTLSTEALRKAIYDQVRVLFSSRLAEQINSAIDHSLFGSKDETSPVSLPNTIQHIKQKANDRNDEKFAVESHSLFKEGLKPMLSVSYFLFKLLDPAILQIKLYNPVYYAHPNIKLATEPM